MYLLTGICLKVSSFEVHMNKCRRLRYTRPSKTQKVICTPETGGRMYLERVMRITDLRKAPAQTL